MLGRYFSKLDKISQLVACLKLFPLLLISSLAWGKTTDLMVERDMLIAYQKFLNGRAVLDISAYHQVGTRRDVLDMVLILQAIKLGGYRTPINLIATSFSLRNELLLKKGKVALVFDSFWLADAREMLDYVYVSDPIVAQGEYLAGIYTRVESLEDVSLKTQHGLSGLTAVSNPSWRTDWQTLSQLPLNNLVAEDNWIAEAQMVDKGLVDFMMMTFVDSGREAYKLLEQIELVVVPKVAIALSDSRHVVVSRAHSDGVLLFSALQRGLKTLREQGVLYRAYQEAGFTPYGEFRVIRAELTRKSSLK